MITIKIGSRGDQIKQWQLFLIGQGFLIGIADGIFGPATDKATKEFQKKYSLEPDGIVGQLTYAKAMTLNLPVVKDLVVSDDKAGDYYWNPPLPNFRPLVSNVERQKIFGAYKYKINPDGQNITIIDDWQKKN